MSLICQLTSRTKDEESKEEDRQGADVKNKIKNLLAPEEEIFCRKHLCTIVFLVFRRIGEYISLNLFYFVSLTSSCFLVRRQLCLLVLINGDNSSIYTAQNLSAD